MKEKLIAAFTEVITEENGVNKIVVNDYIERVVYILSKGLHNEIIVDIEGF